MPRLTFKKDEAPIQVPNFSAVDLSAWLNATEEVKNEKGEVTGTKHSNVSEAVASELANAEQVKDDSGRVIALKTDNLVAEIQNANTKIDEKVYTDEYVSLRALTVQGMSTLMEGVMDITVEGEGEEATEKPSATKYFNQGFGILARNAAAARIRTKVEGPDKALEAAARDLARAKGWTFEKALAKVKLMAAED